MTLPIGSGAPKQPQQPQKTDAQSTWASWTLIGLAIAAVIMLAAYGISAVTGGSAETGESSISTDANTVTQKVTVEGYTFVPNTVDVPAGARLVLEIENTDTMQHDLKIGDKSSGLIKPGESTTFDAGTFTQSVEGYCTVAGHRAMGMTFTVNVTDAATDSQAMDHSTHMSTGQTAGAIGHVPTLAERTAPREGFAARDASLAPAPEETVHEMRLVMREEIKEVAPGREQTVWTFNGEAPGPVIRGKVGDTFRIEVVNEGTMDHSVDFHAGEVNPDNVMRSIAPGESLMYEFTAQRSGIWMYHCATSPMSLHIANGMAGLMIIDPPGLTEVDHEFAFAAHEVFLGERETGADAQRVTDGQYDLTAFNGYPNQYALDPLEVKTGETVRIWVQNSGVDLPVAFHIVGELFQTVFTEGQYTIRDATDTGAQVLPLLAAQGGFVEVTFNEPGTYVFVNHQMTDNEKGQNGKIVVTD